MRTPITLCCSIILFGASAVFAGMDDAQLKERLTDGVFELIIGGNYNIKEEGVTDEQFYRVLMELYRTAEDKWPTLTPNTAEWGKNRDVVIGVLLCLPKCGEIPVKDFLLDYASSEKNDSRSRPAAIRSYLRVADAEEAKDALLRFMVGEERMDAQARSSICQHARTAFMEADARKRSAILESLYVALAREDNKWLFRVYDDVLCELSHPYADSHQRLALLLRLINAPSLCKGDEAAMPWLLELQKVLQKKRPTTNINTNLAALESTDFSLPQPALPSNGAADAVRENAGTGPQTADGSKRGPGRYAVFGLPALILLALGVWRFLRK